LNIPFDTCPAFGGHTTHEQAYIRELLQIATIDDLLGPASGPEEEIVGMSVRDRYLVGKLAPRTDQEGEPIDGLQGPSVPEDGVGDGEETNDLQPLEEIGTGRDKGGRRLLPGEEFPTANGSSDTDDDEG